MLVSVLECIHLPLEAPSRTANLFDRQFSNVLLHSWWIKSLNWNQKIRLVSSAKFSKFISSHFISQMLSFISFYKVHWELWIKTLFKTYNDNYHSSLLRANYLSMDIMKEWNVHDVVMNARYPYIHSCSLAEQRQFYLIPGFIYMKTHCISLIYATFSKYLQFYCASSNNTSENRYVCH